MSRPSVCGIKVDSVDHNTLLALRGYHEPISATDLKKWLPKSTVDAVYTAGMRLAGRKLVEVFGSDNKIQRYTRFLLTTEGRALVDGKQAPLGRRVCVKRYG